MNTDQLRHLVMFSVVEKLGEFSAGFFECNCFVLYLKLAENNDDDEMGLAAREILAGYEWDDCPEPRCCECNDELYHQIQDWMPIIISGGLKKRWQPNSK